jgi:cobalt-precorrin 5A hydrolase
MSAQASPVEIAIGLGCRKGVSGVVIASLVREALAMIGRAGSAALFTVEGKRAEAGMAQAAQALAMPLHFLPQEALEAVADQAQTRSPRVEALFGVPSVAETAALAGAGPGAVLILPRIARDDATCAIARAPLMMEVAP